MKGILFMVTIVAWSTLHAQTPLYKSTLSDASLISPYYFGPNAYVVREVTGMPLAAIGTEFGGRDHSNIVYAINTVNEALKKDENWL